MRNGSGRTLARLFGDCVSAFPDNAAVRYGGKTISYAELNAQANRLAARLESMGAGRGSFVGVCMERSPELIATILAILKTGAAYVPLDRDYPAERLRFMAADANISVIAVSGGIPDALTVLEGAILRVDSPGEIQCSSGEAVTAPAHAVCEEDDPAYVMYTSGSTGMPKGVVVPHRAIVRLVRDTDYLPFGPDLVFLLMSSISFDASTFELWGPLLNGGTCVVYPPGLPDFGNLAAAIRRNGVSVLWLTAALFNAVVDEAPEILSRLDFLLTGGEALSVPHVRKALAALPNVRLYNGYGPTENTTFTCCYPIPDRLAENLESVPIGRPIAGTSVVLLDEEGRPVSEGETGEIHIGGTGLALGYLNRPELTAEAFITAPETCPNGGRLYRSGDLARRLPDGNYEFLGRRDSQLKIRGYRIEPGEIEQRILENPDVGAAAVVPRRHPARKTTLAAFVSAAPGKTVTASSLEEGLTRSLPRYMIPESIIILERMPVLPSGKIDRMALKIPPTTGEGDRTAGFAEENQLLVAALVEEILGSKPPISEAEPIAIDSLDSVRLVSRLRDEGYELDYGTLASDPSVSGIASALIPSARCRPEYAGVAEERMRSGGRIGLTSVQRSVFFLEKLRRGNPAYRFQAAVHFQGDLRIDILQHALDTVIRRHQILRTTFPEVDGVPVQKIHPPWKTDIPVVDLQGAAAESAVYRNAVDSFLSEPMNLEEMPLIRHRLFRIHPRRHVLVSVEHHLIHDGHSFAVILSEIAECYRAYSRNTNPELPDVSWQYADFTCWEEDRAAGRDFTRHSEFWRKELRDAPASTTIPPDRPRPAVKSFKGRRIDFFLDEDISEDLRRAAEENHVSLFSIMLAGFFTLVNGLTGKGDLVVGTGAANRESESVQGILGMFVNTLPIRTRIGGGPFADFCRHVDRQVKSALSHQSLPIAEILKAAGTGTKQGETPMVDMMFNFHDSRMPDPALPGLETKVEYLHNGSAKYDLNVICVPDSRNLVRSAEAEAAAGYKKIFVMWEYSTELYSPARMARIVEAFVSLLRSAAARADRPLSDIARAAAGSVNRIRPNDIARSAARRIGQVPGAGGLIRSAWAAMHRRVSSKTPKPAATAREERDRAQVSRQSAERLIIGVWKDLLGRDFIGPDDDFFKSGGDSLSSVVFCSRFRAMTGIDLPLTTLFANPTPAGLSSIVTESRIETPDVVVRKKEGAPVLFLFHGDFNGGGFYARSLADSMPSGFNIVCLNPHGQLGRPLPKTIESMATDFLEIVLRRGNGGPFYLAGHCNGGLVAFETARQLRSLGMEIGGLFLMDPATPSLVGVRRNAEKSVARYLGRRTATAFADMEPEKRIKNMTALYKKICGVYAVRGYDGPGTLYLGWNSRAVTSGVEGILKEAAPRLETEIVSGDHQTMVTEHPAAMAARIGKRLLESLGAAPDGTTISLRGQESPEEGTERQGLV